MRDKNNETRLCPVCHEQVDEQEASAGNLVVYYKERFYYLMCRRCKSAFLRDPERYLNGRRRAPPLVIGPCARGDRAGCPVTLGKTTNDSEEC